MNNIRAVHTELVNAADTRSWLIATTACIYPTSYNTVLSQSICGEHWWLHTCIKEGVPMYRGECLPHDSTWSPFYE